MEKMNNADYKLFCTIAKMRQDTLLKTLKKCLERYYPLDKIVGTKKYLLCEGNTPIMLVAHLDTVFKVPPIQIYHDQQQHVLWSPDGLGADDRAGVFVIMKILQSGLLPHICFTTDEEIGGLGASALIKKFTSAPFDIKYIVELDRQGACDCVFYSCANQEFQNFIEKYNFITEWGTFSDISIICPFWKIAGVNLSVGYLNEHSIKETLHTDALYTTINKVKKMIMEIKDAPYFKYICSPYDNYWQRIGKYYGMYYDFPMEDDFYPVRETGPYQCHKCKRGFIEDDILVVKSKIPGEKVYYCIDCVGSGVNWCERCGEPFEASNPYEIYCSDCAKNKEVTN